MLIVFPALLTFSPWELAGLLTAIFFHELGHALALWGFGKRIYSLRWSISGPILACESFDDHREELCCALAGPLSGFLWAWAARCLPAPFGPAAAGYSVLLSLFNLLPVPSLDGGRMLLSTGLRPSLVRLLGLLFCAALLLRCLSLRLWPSALLLLRLWFSCLFPPEDCAGS